MKTITINVTQDDIDRGMANDCSACPIARALRGLVLCGADVGSADVDFYVAGSFAPTHTATLPEHAQVFVERFDRGVPVQPFTFTLDVPAYLVADQQ